MGIIINPGTEPIEQANVENAKDNMKHFITDCSAKDLLFVRVKECDGSYAEDGRFAFLVYKDDCTRCHLIHMPGLSLEKVRHMNSEKQNIWHFPRLYIDHSSWVWCYALLDEEDFKEPEDD